MTNKLAIALSLIAAPVFAQDAGLQLSYAPDTPNVVPAESLNEYTQFIASSGTAISPGDDAFLSVVSVMNEGSPERNISFGISRESIEQSNFYDAPGFIVMGAGFDQDAESCVLFSSNTIDVGIGDANLGKDFEQAILDVSPQVLEAILENRCMAFRWPVAGVLL